MSLRDQLAKNVEKARKDLEQATTALKAFDTLSRWNWKPARPVSLRGGTQLVRGCFDKEQCATQLVILQPSVQANECSGETTDKFDDVFAAQGMIKVEFYLDSEYIRCWVEPDQLMKV